MQPGNGALHHPAVPKPEPCATPRRAITGQIRRPPQPPPVLVVVIATVSQHRGGSARPAGLPRMDRVQQRQQLGHVVAIAAGHA